ncbi:MAG: hypothetical protein JRI27_00560 [Deltaproteobacteria bacterium]|nr:hypothetical protein [Deltaproteobacteria bacterium]
MNKKIPKFKSEDKEREFWATADSTEYINWEKTLKLQMNLFNRSLELKNTFKECMPGRRKVG